MDTPRKGIRVLYNDSGISTTSFLVHDQKLIYSWVLDEDNRGTALIKGGKIALGIGAPDIRNDGRRYVGWDALTGESR